ncbi:MAG: cysteine--tRNA ligase [Actinobacteria bacterium]|nr:cysteine--tRNA ligase [Actinomycetota bacterium]
MRVHDSLTKRTVPLETRDEGRVAMYYCGPTVYNYIHIGNARTTLWFDFIRRYLTYRGYDVTYVMNYTDVDDKIIERANLEKIPPDAVSKKYTAAFERDMAGLGARPADILPRATDHIPDMIDTIASLIEKGFAYEADGNVWFAVESFEGYGKLSGRTLEDMRAGERIEPHAGKRHPLDFSLWKAAKEGEPSWESPWGPGRPGWHIECSVMSTKYLDMGFDIHGGATDLIFPHHENEIAQAEAFAGQEPFVRHWLHAGLVQMEDEKMSKSLGNFVLAKDILERQSGESVRYWALAGSYRAQPSFSEESLRDAEQAYERWKTFYDAAAHLLGQEMPEVESEPRRPMTEPIASEGPESFVARLVDALDDDFNSAGAFAAVHEIVKEGNRLLEAAQRNEDAARKDLIEHVRVFLEMTNVLGFSFAAEAADSELVAGLVEYLIDLREQARKEKAFDRADAIRARLLELGIALEDTPAGTRWRLGG